MLLGGLDKQGSTYPCVSVEPGSSIKEALATEEFTFEDSAWINIVENKTFS